MRPLSILFAPFGSEGDLRPVLWLAGGLAARGHRITFAITPYYKHLVESRGWRALDIGTTEDFAANLRDPRLWQPRHGSGLVLRHMLATLPRYAEVLNRTGERYDLAVGTTLGTGALTWAEQKRIPRLMLHLQPMCLHSVDDCPLYVEGAEWFCRAPKFVKRSIYWLVDRQLSRQLFPALNAHRARLGLPPLRHLDAELWNGADAVAALFPAWYAAPQRDWPRHLRQFGFPREASPKNPPPLSSTLEDFLSAGAPPVLWTHGSANLDTEKFAAIARATTRLLGLRGVLIGPAHGEAPANENFFEIAHAPFAQLFPHVRAVVHHGGIGTTAQALAAGLPQLVIPRAHDQPDNARRLERLGVGARLRYAKFSAATAAQKLRELLSSSPTAIACAQRQTEVIAADTLPELCDWAEQLVASC
jgi:rhamnosyltransferase subunit B